MTYASRHFLFPFTSVTCLLEIKHNHYILADMCPVLQLSPRDRRPIANLKAQPLGVFADNSTTQPSNIHRLTANSRGR
jgi:hypothetical protein